MKDNPITPSATKGNGRLLALDILRGITIAGMILVNNPGSWGDIYAPLKHAEWNGLTPTDLVFPFFMFIMGISTYFSLRKYDFKLTGKSLYKIVRRTVLIFLIGLALAWFGLFLRGVLSDKTFLEAVANFDSIRILGVFPRLALCYGFGAFFALVIPQNRLAWVIAGLLVVYSVILLFGKGYDYSDQNVIAVVDRHVLGENHMYTSHYNGETFKFDPEGLLSTLPSIAHVLIGFLCGSLIMKTKDNNLRINSLFIVGTILTISGFLLDFGLPINKKIWSPTFVLNTCGLASSFLGLLIWIIDIKKKNKWCRFFEVFGINPLFLFCLASVLTTTISAVKIADKSLKGWCYDALMPICFDNATLASLVFALLFVLLNWCIGYILYKKKIIIKL